MDVVHDLLVLESDRTRRGVVSGELARREVVGVERDLVDQALEVLARVAGLADEEVVRAVGEDGRARSSVSARADGGTVDIDRVAARGHNIDDVVPHIGAVLEGGVGGGSEPDDAVPNVGVEQVALHELHVEAEVGVASADDAHDRCRVGWLDEGFDGEGSGDRRGRGLGVPGTAVEAS